MLGESQWTINQRREMFGKRGVALFERKNRRFEERFKGVLKKKKKEEVRGWGRDWQLKE